MLLSFLERLVLALPCVILRLCGKRIVSVKRRPVELEGLAGKHDVGFGVIDLEPCLCAQRAVLGLYPANVKLPNVRDVVLTIDLELRNGSRILVVWVSSVE